MSVEENQISSVRHVDFRRRADGEPPDNEGMEARLDKLEAIAEKTGERLANIERDLAVMKVEATSFKAEAFRAFATKEDLHRELNGMTWKLGVAIILAQLLPAIPAMLRAFKLIA